VQDPWATIRRRRALPLGLLNRLQRLDHVVIVARAEVAVASPAIWGSLMRPPGALSSMKHTSPCEPKNVRSGKPAATPIFFNLAAVTTSRFTARDVRVDPARHEPAPDGIDHGTRGICDDGSKTLPFDHQYDREFPGGGQACPMTGEAKVTQLGKTVAFVEGKLMAADGTVLATASSSARLVEADKAIR
jgi:hypothetical protein